MEENNENRASDAPKRSMMPLIIGVIILLLIAGGAYLFMSNNNGMSPADSNTTVTEVPTISTSENTIEETDLDDSGVEDASVKTFEVAGSSFKFDPTEIKVKKGDTVKIVFTNSGGSHDWVLDEFDARTEILESGQTETIEFVADQVGTFEYYCSVGNHRQMGMVGNLVVEE